eukprot:1161051-Pelagomonas_calceolata.AAC.1
MCSVSPCGAGILRELLADDCQKLLTASPLAWVQWWYMIDCDQWCELLAEYCQVLLTASPLGWVGSCTRHQRTGIWLHTFAAVPGTKEQ